MRVRELTISNFRAFSEPPPFRFSERFTVIAGVNGRGKTAVLDGLAILFSRLLPLISPARGGHRLMTRSDIHIGTESAILSMKVNCAGIPLDYRLTLAREDRRIVATELTDAVRREVQTIYGDPHRADDAGPLVVYYTTDRAGYSLPRILPTEVPRGQAVAYTGALRNRTVNFRDFMSRFRSTIILENEQRRENPAFLGDRVVVAISEALHNFLGEFRNLRVETDPLRLLIDKGDVPLDLSQLSDGERSFLALVCDLCRRLALANPLLPNPLHGAGVVLIDELELHLHPTWQREVAQKLRTTFPNIQFVATTHSPFVIQSIRPGELINLDPEEFAEYADKSIEDIAEQVMGVEVPQKSERFLQMMQTAEEYFQLLRHFPAEPEDAIRAAEQRLNELAARYSDDPAFQALLKIERTTLLGGENNAPR